MFEIWFWLWHKSPIVPADDIRFWSIMWREVRRYVTFCFITSSWNYVSLLVALIKSSSILLALPKLQNLKKNRFGKVQDIKQNASSQLLTNPKVERQECFRKWESNLKKDLVILKGDFINTGYHASFRTISLGSFVLNLLCPSVSR